MTAITVAVADSRTMIGRVLRHTSRNPSTQLMAIMLPLILLLLMDYGFGGALQKAGISNYVNYLIPGIIMMGAGYSGQSTAVAVNSDMNEGIIDRFRTLPIARGSVLTGHVIGNTLRTGIGIAVVMLVGLAIGFRPTSNAVNWLGVVGIVLLLLLAVSWIATALGLAASNASGAASMASLITFLPFFSGAFVPTQTMPGWLQVFSAHQPMAPIINTLRDLMTNTPVGNQGVISVAWCAGIIIVGYIWSKSIFSKRTVR